MSALEPCSHPSACHPSSSCALLTLSVVLSDLVRAGSRGLPFATAVVHGPQTGGHAASGPSSDVDLEARRYKLLRAACIRVLAVRLSLISAPSLVPTVNLLAPVQHQPTPLYLVGLRFVTKLQSSFLLLMRSCVARDLGAYAPGECVISLALCSAGFAFASPRPPRWMACMSCSAYTTSQTTAAHSLARGWPDAGGPNRHRWFHVDRPQC